MIESAIGTFVMVLFLFAWIGFERVVKFGVFADITVHSALAYMFIGTYAGMMTGILAATLVSCFLQLMRRYYKAKRRHHDQANPTKPMEQQVGHPAVHKAAAR